MALVRRRVGQGCEPAGPLKLIATDGHRLARFVGSLPPGSECDAGEEPVKTIVPVRLLNEGVRLGGKLGGSVMFELYEKAAAVRINGSIRIWSKCIEGQYPGYEGTIPYSPLQDGWSAICHLTTRGRCP